MRIIAPMLAGVVLATTIATAALAAAPTQQPTMQQQLQKALGNGKSGESMGQAMVVGMLLGCTNKQVGKEATQAFYQQMQMVGKTVETYCKQGNSTEARALVLATLTNKQNDPVLQSALTCYDSQSGNIAGLGGQKMATDAAHYARWARNPAVANSEMKTTDVCR